MRGRALRRWTLALTAICAVGTWTLLPTAAFADAGSLWDQARAVVTTARAPHEFKMPAVAAR